MPIYFTKDTEDAIVEYNNSDDQVLKNKIYKDRIEYSFNKLVENIIYSFKLTSKYDNFTTLRDKTVGDLILKLNKFNPGRKSKKGNYAKAFSFFGTVAKNFIMMEWKKEWKTVSLQDFDQSYDSDEYTCKTENILDKFCSKDDLMEKNEIKQVILEFLQKEEDKYAKNFGIEVKILDAIQAAFRKDYGHIIGNKKALFLYLRENTCLTTTEISGFLSKFRPKFKEFLKSYYRGDI